MKLKKLLAAASALALIPVSANALTIAPNAGTASGSVLANEVDFSAGAISGTFGFSVGLTGGGFFPDTDNMLVTVTLPPHVSYTNMAGAQAADITSATDSVNVQTANSYLVNLPTGSTQMIFDLPLTVTSCPAPGASNAITVSVVLANGNVPVNGGSVSSTDMNVITPTCVDGVFGAVLADDVATSPTTGPLAGVSVNSDTQVALPAYTSFVEFGPNGTGTLGWVSYDTAAPALTGLLPAPNVAAGDVTNVVTTVTFSGPGVGGLTLGGTACTAGAAGSNAFTCTVPGTSIVDTAPLAIVATPAGPVPPATTPAPIGELTATVSAAQVNFGNAALIASEAGATGDLDRLQLQGASFGPFDWNNAAGAVNSVYRITGLPATPVDYTISYEKCNSGQNITSSVLSVTGTNGEAVITSRGVIEAANAGYGRCDVSFNFRTGAPIDVDRLISSGGIVSDFGGNANSNGRSSSAGADSDNRFTVSGPPSE